MTAGVSSPGRAWPDGLRQRVQRGISANALAQAVNVISQLLLVPLFLVHWGPARYGEWLLLGAIPSALGLADLGLATAAANAMVVHIARGERERVSRLAQGLIGFWLIAAALSVLAGAVLLALLPMLSAIVGIALPRLQALAVPAALLAAYTLLMVLTAILTAPLNALKRYALGMHVGSVLRCLELLATIAAVVASDRLDVLCVALLGTRALGVLGLVVLMRRIAPWLTWRPSFSAAWHERGLVASGLSFLAFPLVNALMNQGVLVAVGASVGTAAVAGFSVLRSLTRLVSQCLNVVIQAVQPEVTHAHAERDMVLMRELCRHATRLAFRLGLGACVLVVVAGPWFLTVWTHRLIAVDNVLLVLLALAQAVTSVWLASAIAVAGTNQHRRMSIHFIVLALAAVAACALTSDWAGLRGAACVLVVADLLMARFTIQEACRLLGDAPRRYLAAVMRPAGRP